MKSALVRVGGIGLIALFLLPALEAAQVTAPAQSQAARVPRDAHELRSRDDLSVPTRQGRTIRILVGLETAQDRAAAGKGIPNQAREQDVLARQARVLQRMAGLNPRVVRQYRWHHFIAMTVDTAVLDALLADPDVTSIAIDEPIYPLLYDTSGITRASQAWTAGYRGAGQAVAIIDSGVDKTHSFFAGKVVGEACFSNPVPGATTLCPNGQPQQIGDGAGVNCSDSSIGCWHGTHVAGIAAGRYGVMDPTSGGMAPEATVIAIQVFQRYCGGGPCELVAYDSDIMAALEHVYSLRNSLSIASVNMSLGGANYSSTCDTLSPGVTSAIQSLYGANIATVIAAGNGASANSISFPGCISSAVSVGSTTKQNAISVFSNSASFLSLLAPGSSITSSMPGGGYGTTSGTSMATPHVAGAWATLKSAKPSATVPEVLAALQDAGLLITDSRNGIAKSLIQIGDTGTQLGALGTLLGTSNSSGNEIIIDNAAESVQDAAGGRTSTGSWCTAPAGNQYGAVALINCMGGMLATYRWTPTIPSAGDWDVYVWWNAWSVQSAAAAITVVSADGSATQTFNQQTGGGQWVLHGRYTFAAGTGGYVQVNNNGNGHISGDAVRLVPVPPAPAPPPPSEIIIDNAAEGVQDAAGGRTSTGSWCTSPAGSQYGASALHNCLGGSAATYRWTPTIPTAGDWDVYVWWTAWSVQSTTAAITVVSADGAATQTYNQQTGGGQWVLHGRYTFTAGTGGYVQVNNNGTGHISGDAVRLVPVPASPAQQVNKAPVRRR